MLLANYASDSGSDSETEDAGPSRPISAPVAATTTTSKPKRKAPVKITLDLPKSSTLTDTVEDDNDGREFKKTKTSGPKGGKGSYVTPTSIMIMIERM
jgi:hypothetical protein